MPTFVLFHLDTEICSRLRGLRDERVLTIEETNTVERMLDLQMPARNETPDTLARKVIDCLERDQYMAVAKVSARFYDDVYATTQNQRDGWIVAPEVVSVPGAVMDKAKANGAMIRARLQKDVGTRPYPGADVLTQADVDAVTPSIRSTSVGDLVFEPVSGDVYFCASAGWTKLHLGMAITEVSKRVEAAFAEAA